MLDRDAVLQWILCPQIVLSCHLAAALVYSIDAVEEWPPGLPYPIASFRLPRTEFAQRSRIQGSSLCEPCCGRADCRSARRASYRRASGEGVARSSEPPCQTGQIVNSTLNMAEKKLSSKVERKEGG